MLESFPIFDVVQEGRKWSALVEFGRRYYRRPARTQQEANQLLVCLRRNLAKRPGLTIPIVEEWDRGLICRFRRPLRRR